HATVERRSGSRNVPPRGIPTAPAKIRFAATDYRANVRSIARGCTGTCIVPGRRHKTSFAGFLLGEGAARIVRSEGGRNPGGEPAPCKYAKGGPRMRSSSLSIALSASIVLVLAAGASAAVPDNATLEAKFRDALNSPSPAERAKVLGSIMAPQVAYNHGFI